MKVIMKKVGGKPELHEEWEYSHENLNKAVGGWLEAVSLPKGITMWLNEEGLLEGLPLNLVTFVGAEVVHQIVGDVIFTSIDEEGETADLTDKQIEFLQTKFQVVNAGVNLKTKEIYEVWGIML